LGQRQCRVPTDPFGPAGNENDIIFHKPPDTTGGCGLSSVTLGFSLAVTGFALVCECNIFLLTAESIQVEILADPTM
jgi:hypothetical protein